MAGTAVGITAFRAPDFQWGQINLTEGLESLYRSTSNVVSALLDRVEVAPLRAIASYDPVRMIRNRAEFLAGVSPHTRTAETFLDPLLRVVGGMSDQQFQMASAGDSRAQLAGRTEELLRSNMKVS